MYASVAIGKSSRYHITTGTGFPFECADEAAGGLWDEGLNLGNCVIQIYYSEICLWLFNGRMNKNLMQKTRNELLLLFVHTLMSC